MYTCTYVPVGVMYMNVCHLCVGGRMLGLGVGECRCSECVCVRTCVLLLTVTVSG